MFNRRIEDLNTLITRPDPTSLAELYHENSKLRPTNSRQYGEFIASVTKLSHLVEKMACPYKVYPTVPRLKLPMAPLGGAASAMCLEEIIQRRRSARHLSGQALAIEDIARLLQFGCGITYTAPILEFPDQSIHFRAAPSAGALYPLELYLVAWNTLGLQPGIYHYCVPNHALELLRVGNFAQEAAENALSDELAETASGLFVLSAVFQRTMLKYNERGYRFVLIEAGHVAQNICLMASTINVGILPIGGFLDDELNRMLRLDGVNEAVVYALAVGEVELSSERGSTEQHSPPQQTFR